MLISYCRLLIIGNYFIFIRELLIVCRFERDSNDLTLFKIFISKNRDKFKAVFLLLCEVLIYLKLIRHILILHMHILLNLVILPLIHNFFPVHLIRFL